MYVGGEQCRVGSTRIAARGASNGRLKP